MDPTLRQTMQTFLEAVRTDHQLDPDAPGRCTCGAELDPLAGDTEGLAEELVHVLGVIAGQFAPLTLKARKVHQKGAIVADDPVKVAKPDKLERHPGDPEPIDGRAPGTVVSGSRYVGALHCPDCGRGLVGRDDGGLICPQLAPAAVMASCHTGCIVACGAKEGGPADG